MLMQNVDQPRGMFQGISKEKSLIKWTACFSD